MYKARGFNINIYHRDIKFSINSLRQHIRQESLIICEKRKQITIIEISIQTTKQGAHCITPSVPYKRYTVLITSSLLECIIHSRNCFLHKCSIINRLGDNKILLGKLSYDFNMRITVRDHIPWYKQG